jgi:homocysteine S-methyltransferase
MTAMIVSPAYARLAERLGADQVVVLDGATGTELQRRGAPMDPQAWCGPATLHNDALLTQIHSDYMRAGAEVITANTFASSRLMLSPAGLGDRVEEINRRAVEAALRARQQLGVGDAVCVAGSLSHMVPVGVGTEKVDPSRTPSSAEMSHAFHELAHILRDSGVDHIILEMMYNPVRAKLALDAALTTGLPVWFGMSARPAADGRTITFDQLDEYDIAEVASLIPAEGVHVAGFMHTGAELIADALAQARRYFAGPLMAYPDSGYFEMPDWRFVDTIEPVRLQQFFTEWIEDGVRLIGGCCGLTIAHVEAAVRARSSQRPPSSKG